MTGGAPASDGGASRLAAARLRAGRARKALALGAAGAFLAGIPLVRATYPATSTHRSQPASASQARTAGSDLFGSASVAPSPSSGDAYGQSSDGGYAGQAATGVS